MNEETLTLEQKSYANLQKIRKNSVTDIDYKEELAEALDGIFGMWSDYDNEMSVGDTVRKMREGRSFDY